MVEPKLQIEQEVAALEERIARIERLVGYLFARIAPEADIADIGAALEPTGEEDGARIPTSDR